jgi:hypothetical protein
MIRDNEYREGRDQLQFALTSLGRHELQRRQAVATRAVAVAQSAVLPNEIQLSGMRVLIAMACTAGFAGVFLWVFVRYWLFAP